MLSSGVREHLYKGLVLGFYVHVIFLFYNWVNEISKEIHKEINVEDVKYFRL